MTPGAALLLAAGLCAAAPAPSALQSKRYGVLLLGEGGSDLWTQTAENGDGAWPQTIRDARKALGGEIPLEFAPGEADGRTMQLAVDSLEGQGVREIVVVPLLMTSQSPLMDQDRFLLGLREAPSAAFLAAAHSHLGAPPQRLAIKSPLVMSKALDAHPILIDVIAARAQALTRQPQEETLVLIGASPPSNDDVGQWAAVMSTLAQEAGRKAGFKAARALNLTLEGEQDVRDRSERGLRDALRALRTAGGVVVVPVELTPGQEHLRLAELLDGTFVHYDGRDILPDPRIARWIKQSADDASKLPDMRLYKNDGGLKPPPPLTFENKLTIHPPGGKP